MRKTITVSLVMVSLLLSACMPTAQRDPEVDMPGIPAVEEQQVVVEEQAAQEFVLTPEEPVEDVMDEGTGELAALNIPRDFEVKLYQGQDRFGGTSVPISEVFAEGKPVVINFYAGLCPLCNVELPAMQAVYNQYDQQINFVIVDIGPFVGLGSEQDGINMIANLGVSIPGGSISDAGVLRDYGVFGTPAISFFRSDGSLYFQHNGVMSEAQITEQVSGLLQ